MFIIRYYRQQILFLFGQVLIVFLTSGCGTFIQILKYPERLHQAAQDRKTLGVADDAFRNGEYQKAGEYYDLLIRNSDIPEIRRRSMFGLACVQLIFADTCSDLEQAYDLWFAWRNLPQDNQSDTEDPRMVDPVLEKMMSGVWLPGRISKQISADSSDENHDGADAGRGFQSNSVQTDSPAQSVQVQAADPASKNNDEKVEKLLNAREKEIRKLKNQIVKMEADMKVLKEQFSALEEIHQEIQEKKKDIFR